MAAPLKDGAMWSARCTPVDSYIRSGEAPHGRVGGGSAVGAVPVENASRWLSSTAYARVLGGDCVQFRRFLGYGAVRSA